MSVLSSRRLLPSLTALWLAFCPGPVQAEPGGITGIAWAEGSRYLVSEGGERRIRLHDGATGLVLKAVRVPGPEQTVLKLASESRLEVSNDLAGLAARGRYAVTTDASDAVQWWSLPDLKTIASGRCGTGLIGLAMAGQGKMAAYSSSYRPWAAAELEVLHLAGSKVENEPMPELPPPHPGLAFGRPLLSPNGHWLICATGSQATVWDLSHRPARTRPFGDSDLSGAALGNRHFFAIDGDAISMRTYDDPATEVARFPCARPLQVAVDAEERRMLVKAEGGIRIWDLAHPEKPRDWLIHCDSMTASPDLKKVALAQQQRYDVYDLASRRLLFSLSTIDSLKEAPASTAQAR
jgi:hypothetical protein